MSEHDQNLKLLLIGHVSCDMVDGRCALGGAVAFSSKWATREGIYPTVITSCASAYPGLEKLKNWGVKVLNQESLHTTSFTNIYMGNERTQFISARADNIEIETINSATSDADIIFFAPIAQELDPRYMAKLAEGKIMACSIQGWLRKWDDEGKVVATEMDWNLLNQADFVFLSYEDLEGIPDALDKLISLRATTVITDNVNGCDVFKGGNKTNYPTPEVDTINPTGAGDTFATAFLVNYFRTQKIESAARFANLTASKFISSTK
ncbi:MAG: hypothetical protein HKN09_07990 [Saprospiraceae bacterium]|nr:hypothetical protein [Saprospiraceae bacterium]